MSSAPLRAGLAGLIDYAGLFPPASLALSSVLERFSEYSGGPEQWMLGRLIVPLGELPAVAAYVDGRQPVQPAWTLSLLAPAGKAVDPIGDTAARFNARCEPKGVAIVAVEFGAETQADVERGARSIPPWLERYAEVPLDGRLPSMLDTVAREGCYAKFRTGGVSADRFPDARSLARAICASTARDVPFKATAGLHHPLRNRYPLTYEPGSASGRMHGFVNLLAATSLAHGDPAIDPGVVEALLEEARPSAFTVDEETFGWRDYRWTGEELAQVRAHRLRSVGSCSFEEPVADLRALNWMP